MKPSTKHSVKDGRSYMPDSTCKSIIIRQVTQERNPDSQAKELQFRLDKLSAQGYEIPFVKCALLGNNQEQRE